MMMVSPHRVVMLCSLAKMAAQTASNKSLKALRRTPDLPCPSKTRFVPQLQPQRRTRTLSKISHLTWQSP